MHSPPSSFADARWLKLEWSDVAKTALRIVRDVYMSLGWLDARDVPEET